MSNDTAKTQTTNIVPVQGIFEPAPSFGLITLIGPAGTPFYANIQPDQSGLNITDSTINSTTIGLTTPAAGKFTQVTLPNAPTTGTDAVNKEYVDNFVAGISWKEPAEVATTGNITLSGLQTIDDVAVQSGWRVLVKNQSTASQNGIYTASSGAWTRAVGSDTWDENVGSVVFVVQGTGNHGTTWYSGAQPGGTLGSTAINWFELSISLSYTAGTGLTLTGTQFSITNTGVSAATYGAANTVPVFAVNAQGQLTSVSNTAIAIANTQVSGLGTMSTQNANNVAITGGTISGVAITGSTITGYAQSGANSDITSLSGITGGITYPDYITFDTTPETVPTAPGSLYWDSADNNQTLSLVMANGDATQQIGEETYFRIKASSAITNGQLVMFTGSVGASGGLTGAPSTGLTASTASYVMGIATHDIALNGWGYVTAFGLVRNIDTTGSSVGETWADGDILYYNPSVTGGLTKTIPSAPNAKVQVCSVVHAASNGSLFIRPSFGGALGQYEGDVGITTPSNGQLLIRNQTDGKWVNATLGTGSGISATVGAGTLSIANSGVLSIAGTASQITASASTGAITLSLPSTINVDTSGNAATATSATTATNLAGGANGSIPYQSGAGTTTFLSIGTNGKVLTSNGTTFSWESLPSSGITITDDTTTNATRYLAFTSATTGSITGQNVASTKLQFNPSTGLLTATGFSGSGANLTSIPNGALTNSSVTVTAGTGMSGGGAVSLGGSVTLTNAGVTSITGTSNQVTASASTGGVTLSLPQSIATTSSVQFGSFGVGTAASGTSGEIRATNNVTAYYSSDASLKENIADIGNALNIVCAIGSKSFDWTDAYIASKGGEDGYFIQKSDFGVIAQDVQAVFPQAVRTREDGTLAVDYEKLSTLAFGAIQQLVKRIEVLESK